MTVYDMRNYVVNDATTQDYILFDDSGDRLVWRDGLVLEDVDGEARDLCFKDDLEAFLRAVKKAVDLWGDK